MEAVYVALIVAVPAVISPALLAVITGRQRRREKLEDYARQDAVATRLLDANRRVAAMAAEASEATQGQLRQIHTLVNANLTKAQQQELDATVAMAVSMQEVIDLKRTLGVEPSLEALEALATARARVTELSRDVAHRIEQTKVGEQQVANTATTETLN